MVIFDHHGMNPKDMAGISNAELRNRFVATPLFISDKIVLHYSYGERLIVGGAWSATQPLQLVPMEGNGDAPFLDRRELGVINIGGEGIVKVDGVDYPLAQYETLYVGKGAQDIWFSGPDARFYLVSAPAHAHFPTRKITLAQANRLERGEVATANRRQINQVIVPGVCDSAQLALGVTLLDTGSIWNTMAPHRHSRRSEIYMYFNLDDSARVFHFMGEPDNLRQIIVENQEAVISPPWSVHFGVGTRAYAFVWAMAGDNIDYDDMDHLTLGDLR